MLLGRHAALEGAGFSFESVMPLVPSDQTVLPTATVGGRRVFPLHDFVTVLEIGACWTVAGTATALSVDFNLFSNTDGTGVATAKLNGTAGFITSPSVASQVAGRVLTKDIGNAILIDLIKGQSIEARVAVAAAGGSILPYVLVIPRAETNANLVGNVVSL